MGAYGGQPQASQIVNGKSCTICLQLALHCIPYDVPCGAAFKLLQRLDLSRVPRMLLQRLLRPLGKCLQHTHRFIMPTSRPPSMCTNRTLIALKMLMESMPKGALT